MSLADRAHCSRCVNIDKQVSREGKCKSKDLSRCFDSRLNFYVLRRYVVTKSRGFTTSSILSSTLMILLSEAERVHHQFHNPVNPTKTAQNCRVLSFMQCELQR